MQKAADDYVAIAKRLAEIEQERRVDNYAAMVQRMVERSNNYASNAEKEALWLEYRQNNGLGAKSGKS